VATGRQPSLDVAGCELVDPLGGRRPRARRGAPLHRVIGRVEARNIASARVLEKLGMRREAHFVENELVKGEWQSELVYAILDREWRSTR